MSATGLPERVLDAVRGQPLGEILRRAEQRILGAAADPEQLQLVIRFSGIAGEPGIRLGKVRGISDGCTEPAYVTEEIEVVQADAQRLPAAHRQPDDGASIAIRMRAVVRLDVRNHILDEVFPELRRVLRLRS